LAMCACAGLRLTQLSGMGCIPVARGDCKRKATSLTQLIEPMDEVMIHAIEVSVSTVELFESKELEAHFFFFLAFDSAIAIACFSG